MNIFKELKGQLRSHYQIGDIIDLNELMARYNSFFDNVDIFTKYYIFIRTIEETFKLRSVYYEPKKKKVLEGKELRNFERFLTDNAAYLYLCYNIMDVKKILKAARKDYMEFYDKDIKIGFVVKGIK